MASSERPYILLIGIDGLRPDYITRFQAPNLLAFGRNAALSAGKLIPRFPTSTFPNFYSIATGMEPQDHGIVGMHFWDPERRELFDFRTTARDGSWYQGTPIWALAEKHGVLTASYFWVGTDACIDGIRPSHYYPYDPVVTHEARIKQVLDWFALPDAERPNLVTLYFSDVDTAGHFYGPFSDQTRQALLDVDESLGKLFRGMASVRPDANIIIVSDHGMADVRGSIDIAQHVDLDGLLWVNETSHLMLYPAAEQAAPPNPAALPAGVRLFRKGELPERLCFSSSPRIGEWILLPDGPDIFEVKADQNGHGSAPEFRGWHGYDPEKVPGMEGVFFATGPQFRAGKRFDSLPNTAIYPILASILRLPLPVKLQHSATWADAVLS